MATIEGFKMLEPHLGSACSMEACMAYQPMP